eukprot:769669-Rhodomonas_salina.2
MGDGESQCWETAGLAYTASPPVTCVASEAAEGAAAGEQHHEPHRRRHECCVAQARPPDPVLLLLCCDQPRSRCGRPWSSGNHRGRGPAGARTGDVRVGDGGGDGAHGRPSGEVAGGHPAVPRHAVHVPPLDLPARSRGVEEGEHDPSPPALLHGRRREVHWDRKLHTLGKDQVGSAGAGGDLGACAGWGEEVHGNAGGHDGRGNAVGSTQDPCLRAGVAEAARRAHTLVPLHDARARLDAAWPEEGKCAGRCDHRDSQHLLRGDGVSERGAAGVVAGAARDRHASRALCVTGV